MGLHTRHSHVLMSLSQDESPLLSSLAMLKSDVKQQSKHPANRAGMHFVFDIYFFSQISNSTIPGNLAGYNC